MLVPAGTFVSFVVGLALQPKGASRTTAMTASGKFVAKQNDKPLASLTFAILPTVLAITVSSSSPALALDSSVFNNEYADPFHPFCERKIEVKGQSFHFSGTGVGPEQDDKVPLRGCSLEERKQFTLRMMEFDGQIIDGNRISVGDRIHEGVWEPKNTATTELGYQDVDGIRWNDGNKWLVKSQSYVAKDKKGKYVVTKKPLQVTIGEFIFYSYIGFSTLAGAWGVVKSARRKQQDA